MPLTPSPAIPCVIHSAAHGTSCSAGTPAGLFSLEALPMNIDELLDGLARRPRSCKICSDDKLARMVARWLDRKADPDDDFIVPLETFARALRGPDSTMRRHVARCLGRDHMTGAPLGD